MLTVLKEAPKINRGRRVFCICDCGKETIVAVGHLRSGHTKSCGCLPFKHNMRYSKEYKAYHLIISRCYNKNDTNFNNYGGRGIKVCDRWLDGFINFYEDMGKKPSNDYSIDRYPNNDGNYEPNNCRWANRHEQSRNKRTNRFIDYNGESMILEDWSNFFGASSSGVYQKIKRHGFEYAYKYYMDKKNIIKKNNYARHINVY